MNMNNIENDDLILAYLKCINELTCDNINLKNKLETVETQYSFVKYKYSELHKENKLLNIELNELKTKLEFKNN